MPYAPLRHRFRRPLISVAAAATASLLAQPLVAQTANAEEDSILQEVTITAEDQLRQAVGVSTITAQDIENRPPANDLSELIRTMPGVNLTGASSTGAFGNQRQIDIRGMGPENTLILIDGKPVQSRSSSMMRRTGERNTRGDSNWVPASAVERIEVLRGPAAARYGSGAAGGVVNIVTKKPTDQLTGEATVYYRTPQEGNEGDSKRLGFNLAGPLAENLSFRLYGNVAKTDRDEPGINLGVGEQASPAAGREGVRNRDIDGLLRWDLTPDQVLEFEAGLSRQGSIYTGERFIQGALNPIQQQLTDSGAETNRTLRRTASVTHRGNWGDLGNSRVIFQYEDTNRRYINEGAAGSSEGAFTDPITWNNSELKNYYLNGEMYTPLNLGGMSHVLTTGVEYRKEKIKDPGSQNANPPAGFESSGTGKASADTWAVYLEDNIALSEALVLTPGVRLDHHDNFGSNWSPSLNATYQLNDQWSINGGVARAFKAPNIYQSNPEYWYTTMGNGCPIGISGPCYIQGNPDLKPETSINKEIGVAWNNHQGWDASLAFFDNDYKNKIVADMPNAAPDDYGTFRRFQWFNAGKAKVRGLEGSLNIPLLGNHGDTLKLFNNLTVMDQNKNKETGQPLSIIPKYTLNSTLDWRINDKFNTELTATVYGKQKPRTLGSRGQELTTEGRGSYALFGLRANYTINKNLRAGFGVENLGNKRLYRTANSESAGAASYNEPGRAYYFTLTGSF
ncbi:TonB-dependent siderophore receptor [Lampropedia puyangensis]|uniref:TonB-dependent siderophore receptor n=1 Tax=Lampropedia puyangensis TaxID=1330072 RepID=A0A4S8EUI5_9BURK|nr:FepA family TonB-dependent siderophore receptor [Lampropedia puyangensis]THT97950.1 TonB-dependent siderophore receptor [Lampropedia puyangensis]